MKKCKKCNDALSGAYCSSCGFPNELKRIDKQYLIDEISSVVNFDKGIFYTVKELFIRPGAAVKEFILEDRRRLVKPILFTIICSVAYTIVQHYLRFEDGYINFQFADWNDLVIGKMFNWISQNYGYANIMMAVFITFWIKIFFRKYNYNFYEIFILLCFIMGVSMLIFAVFGVIEGLTKYPVLQYGSNVGLLYNAWAIGQFFNRKKFMSYIKGLISYLLGMITFFALVAIIGIILEKFV